MEKINADLQTHASEVDETKEDFEKLLDRFSWDAERFFAGALLRGRIVSISDTDAIIDIGYKTEGIIPSDEIKDLSGEIAVKEGDEIEILIENIDDAEGVLHLSHKKAKNAKAWQEIETAYNEKLPITGKVVSNVKSGLVVDVGLRGFLPASLVDFRRVPNLDDWVGREIEVKIIQYERKRTNIVLSRRAVLEESYIRRKKETLASLEIGKIVKGKVKGIAEFGVFVDIGGIDGLLHVTDIAWRRVEHPNEVFKIGQETELMVLGFNPQTEKVSLGLKQLTRDPWEFVEETYPRGKIVKGKVIGLKDFGAFVDFGDGIEGIISTSEMSWTKRLRHAAHLLKFGEEITARVLDYDFDNRRLNLGMKQLTVNPWEEFEKKHRVGERAKGKVTGFAEYGAFVELEGGVHGLAHVSDLSWTERVKHPSDVLQKGQEIEAVVLAVDVANQRVSLGIKQLEPSAWDKFFETHKVGDLVKGKVTHLTDYGAFIELAEGVEGLAHISELADHRINRPSEVVGVGDEIEVRLIKMNRDERKINLSYRLHSKDEIKTEERSEDDGRIRIKDMVKDKLISSRWGGGKSNQ